MLFLTVNSGSTSVKLAAFASSPAKSELALLAREQYATDGAEPHAVLREFLRKHGSSALAATAHRVVHGGARFTAPVRIDPAVEAAIGELAALAPLHNAIALRWIAAARAVCTPQVEHVAVFDTAFFAALPALAAQYALPARAGAALGVRRYGFHGLAHEALWRRWRELNPRLDAGGRVLTLQLGGGCSIAAIEHGRPLDTSMGFSPLEGLVMATRSGDLDPALVPYLAGRLETSAASVIEMLNEESGLLGLSGSSGDMRELLEDSREPARFAVELYCYRARKYVGAYLAVLRGCDGVVFGGGVGEHLPEIRERILGPLSWAGVELDPRANRAALGREACISRDGSPIRVWVIPVDEEHTLAAAARALARPQAARE